MIGYILFAAVLVYVVYRAYRYCKHEWSRPLTRNGKRIEECERCGAERDHVGIQIDRNAPVFTQSDLDGTVGAPSVKIVPFQAVVDAEIERMSVKERAK